MKKYNNFKKINELNIPTIRLDDLVNGITHANKTLKNVLATYYKTYEDYIDLIDKEKHLYKVYDMSGDIVSNNKAFFNACIFEEQDLIKIKENIVDYSIGEFHASLPFSLNIFGIDLKPSAYVNKDDLKMTFDELITTQNVIDIITMTLNYQNVEKFNDFYVWSNKQ